MTASSSRGRIALLLVFVLISSRARSAEQTTTLDGLCRSLQKQEQSVLGQYAKSLDAIMQSLKQKGDLDTYLVVENERKRFSTEKTVPIPAQAQDAFRPAAEAYYKATIDLLKKQLAGLDEAVRQSMVADKIDQARAAKEEKGKIEFALADAESKLLKAQPSTAQKATLAIDAKQQNWQGSGLSVDKGTKVTITTDGEVMVGNNPTADSRSDGQDLQVRFGDGKSQNVGGSPVEITADESGEVSFRMADINYNDNVGRYEVSVEPEQAPIEKPEPVTTANGAPQNAPVPAGKKPYPSDAVEFKGHHYKYIPEVVTWERADMRCKSMGGHLATISDAEENNFLLNLGGEWDEWIGLRRMGSDWRWVDKSPMSYANWGPGQPDLAKQKGRMESENSGQLIGARGKRHDKDWGWYSENWHGKWNDMLGTVKDPNIKGYVCEWDY